MDPLSREIRERNAPVAPKELCQESLLEVSRLAGAQRLPINPQRTNIRELLDAAAAPMACRMTETEAHVREKPRVQRRAPASAPSLADVNNGGVRYPLIPQGCDGPRGVSPLEGASTTDSKKTHRVAVLPSDKVSTTDAWHRKVGRSQASSILQVANAYSALKPELPQIREAHRARNLPWLDSSIHSREMASQRTPAAALRMNLMALMSYAVTPVIFLLSIRERHPAVLRRGTRRSATMASPFRSSSLFRIRSRTGLASA